MKLRTKTVVMLLAAALLLCSCKKPFETDTPMCGFAFSHSGMHTGLIYTLEAERAGNGWQSNLSLLAGEKEYTLDMTAEEAEALAALVRNHELDRWNGYDRVDRHALDGTAFDLRIGYEDGQEVRASGSNAFPEGYAAAHEAILKFFGELMEESGIENPL